MAAAWQASGTLLGALTTADVTPVIPTHAADDILICITANRVITNTCSTPSGWTAVGGGPVDTTAWRTYAFWKRAAGSSETNPLCDWTATSADKYAQVHTIRGAITTGTPFDIAVIRGNDTDPNVLVSPSNGTTSGLLVIAAALGSDNASASVTVTATDPTFLTQRHFSTIATGADATGEFHDGICAGNNPGGISYDHNSTMPTLSALIATVFNPASAPGPARRRRPAHRFLTLR